MREGFGTVEYVFAPDEQTVYYRQIEYSASFALDTAEPRPLLTGVETLTFSYYYYDDQKRSFFWAGEWPPPEYASAGDPGWPLGIRCSLTTADGAVRDRRVMTVDVPQGGQR